MKQTLYDLTEAHVRLLELFDSGDIDQAAMDEYIANDLAEATEAKLEAYAKVIRTQQAAAAMYKTEKDLFAAKEKHAETVVDTLKARLKYHLEAIGVSTAKAGPFTIALQSNPAAVEVDDVHALPGDLVIVTETADKRAIKERLEAGDDIPGCRLTRGQSVRIR